MPQQAMLDGIHLAMGCALVVGVVVVMFALRLKAHQKINKKGRLKRSDGLSTS